jgi:rhodanese-related sulfurtransferase
MSSAVNAVPAAAPADALAHFEARLAYETDCWDVHEAMSSGEPDFVLVDVRSLDLFAAGHVPGAVNIPHRTIDEARLGEYAETTVFVVYCAGPHCNGAQKGAVQLARLGRPVKEMIGGVTGWLDEGFELTGQPVTLG